MIPALAVAPREFYGPDPLIQAVLANTKPGGYVGHLVTTLGDLFDRFYLEFFGLSLPAHGTPYWASGLRIRGVWKTRGDSDVVQLQCFVLQAERGRRRVALASN